MNLTCIVKITLKLYVKLITFKHLICKLIIFDVLIYWCELTLVLFSHVKFCNYIKFSYQHNLFFLIFFWVFLTHIRYSCIIRLNSPVNQVRLAETSESMKYWNIIKNKVFFSFRRIYYSKTPGITRHLLRYAIYYRCPYWDGKVLFLLDKQANAYV